MSIKSEYLGCLLFMILVLITISSSIICHVKKAQDRLEERKVFVDTLLADFTLYGEIVEVITVETSGRRSRLWCIEIIESSKDSFYIFSRKHDMVLKIQNNLAVVDGSASDSDRLKFIDININYPGMVTLYVDKLEIIRQRPMNVSFGTMFLLERDMKICDHHIVD